MIEPSFLKQNRLVAAYKILNNMFCPQCSNHNLDGAKFCRVCGTNLELVSLALTNRLPAPLPSSGNPQKAAGTGAVVQGSILLGTSLLIMLVGMLFSQKPMPWLFFWSVFFGWMACWGSVSLAIGVGRMIERKVSPSVKEAQLTQVEDSPVGFLPTTSVTDHTTRQLGQRKS
jgi:hypothetical protein